MSASHLEINSHLNQLGIISGLCKIILEEIDDIDLLTVFWVLEF